LVEIFGDTREVDRSTRWVAILETTASLRLLDLVDDAMAAGTIHAISGIGNRSLTQQWSRFFYERVDYFGTIDGLYYAGAHNGGHCIALYERAESKVSATAYEPLSSGRFDAEVLLAVDRYNLVLA
jgi:hypothetical protein